MEPQKVVICGPFGAGKTTFVRTISEICVLSTESSISDGTGDAAKTSTTVAIDFGRITLAPDLSLYLFGTPGQERFSFMWDVAGKGMLGYICVVDASRPGSYVEARTHLAHFRDAGAKPFLVAVNKAHDPIQDCREAALALGVAPEQVIGVDCRDRDSVRDALVMFLEAVLTSIETRTLATV